MANIKLFIKYELFPRFFGMAALIVNILHIMNGASMHNAFFALYASLFIIDYITGIHDRLHAYFGNGRELVSYLMNARHTCLELCILESITMVPNDSRRTNRLI